MSTSKIAPVNEAMAGWLRESQMDPATKCDWDKLSPEARRGLERAATGAHRMIEERMPRVVPKLNSWQIVRLDKRMSGEPMIAASGAMLGRLWNPKEVSTCDVAFKDGSGALLDGRNRYVIRFAQQPPVNAFWSLTMYSAENQLFVPNAINRYSVGDRTKGTVVGKDESMEILLQADEPTDPVERANWLPAPKGPVLSPDPALLAEGADPDRRLAAAADHKTRRSDNSGAVVDARSTMSVKWPLLGIEQARVGAVPTDADLPEGDDRFRRLRTSAIGSRSVIRLSGRCRVEPADGRRSTATTRRRQSKAGARCGRSCGPCAIFSPWPTEGGIAACTRTVRACARGG